MKQSSRRMGVNRLEGQSVVVGQLWPWEWGWGLSLQLSCWGLGGRTHEASTPPALE